MAWGISRLAFIVLRGIFGASCSRPTPEEADMRLKDKVAIVTGGAHGMGEAEARLFAAEGAKVVVADILEHEAEIVAADIRAGGEEAMAAKINVTNESEWVGLIAKTVATYGKLDILVNNAGISGSSVSDPDGLEGWDRIIAVNQTSVFLGTKLAAEQMAKTGGGSIINISSIMGFIGSASGHPAYHASKGAVRIYSKAAAVRYGPSGVRVNTVHPGYMPPMLNATNAGERADKIAMTPLRRIGKPIEVAYGVLFLASDEASFITGTELVIDGGFIAQ
jgi:NAD(P)-dependent dehydrogenase (short-subunit alcohol dehydrogenase family)